MKLSRNNLLILHILLGFAFWEIRGISTFFGILIVLLGTYYILRMSDPNGVYPLYFSAYIVGSEVLLRMTGSLLFWEFGKYAVIYFLLLGIIRKSNSIEIYSPILYYFLLLMPGLIFVPLDSFNQWRQDIAFNISGPALLTISTIYFYQFKNINKEIFKKIILYMILPIISMGVYNIFTMPDLGTYQFAPYSDSSTSGGYGPNQVSTLFGVGITGLIACQMLKINIFNHRIIDLLILIIFFSLGLITFSRGGIFAAVISSTFAISYILFHYQKRLYFISKFFGLFTVSIVAWVVIVSITDGVIEKRYGLGSSTYGEKFFLDLTGRALIYEIDIEIFFDYFFTGVGPGQSTGLRDHYGYGKKAAAHTEYSRMLAEHGILGMIALCILFLVVAMQINKVDFINAKFIKILFGFLAILTMGHSAMRLAMPSFIYGFLLMQYRE